MLNKKEWLELIEAKVETLRQEAVEAGQEEFLDFFMEQEEKRMEAFCASEGVGYAGEIEGIFGRYQGTYKYEKNASFSSLSVPSL